MARISFAAPRWICILAKSIFPQVVFLSSASFLSLKTLASAPILLAFISILPHKLFLRLATSSAANVVMKPFSRATIQSRTALQASSSESAFRPYSSASWLALSNKGFAPSLPSARSITACVTSWASVLLRESKATSITASISASYIGRYRPSTVTSALSLMAWVLRASCVFMSLSTIRSVIL